MSIHASKELMKNGACMVKKKESKSQLAGQDIRKKERETNMHAVTTQYYYFLSLCKRYSFYRFALKLLNFPKLYGPACMQ